MVEERDYRKEFVEHFEYLRNIGKFGQSQEDPRAKRKDEGMKKLREIAYNTLVEYKNELGPKFDVSMYTPETLPQDKLEFGIKFRQDLENEKSALYLVDNFKEVVSKINPKSLEELALQEQFMESSDPELQREYKDSLGLYAKYLHTKNLVERYKNGENLKEEEEQHLYAAAAKESSERIKERLKREGHSSHVQEMGANIAYLFAKNKAVKRGEMIKDSENILKRSEEDLRKYEEDKGKKVSDYVIKSLEKMVKDEDPKKFSLAREYIYHAATKKEK